MNPPTFYISPGPSDADFVPAIAPTLRNLKSVLIASNLDDYLTEQQTAAAAFDVNSMLPGIQQWAANLEFGQFQVCIHKNFLWLAIANPGHEEPGVTAAWKQVTNNPSLRGVWMFSAPVELPATKNITTRRYSINLDSTGLPTQGLNVKAVSFTVYRVLGGGEIGQGRVFYRTGSGLVDLKTDGLWPIYPMLMLPVTNNVFSVGYDTLAQNQNMAFYLHGWAV
jgi:hypothetical protein